MSVNQIFHFWETFHGKSFLSMDVFQSVNPPLLNKRLEVYYGNGEASERIKIA